MKVKVAIAQIDTVVGDVRANLEKHIEYVQKAKKMGVQIIVFPELSLHGYTLRDLAWDLALDPRKTSPLDPLKKLSDKISILAGAVESAPDHGIYNSAFFLEDREIRNIHRKIYLPTYGMFEEGRYFSPGTVVRSFDSKYGRFSTLICEDHWHPSLLYLSALDGAEAIFIPTASPSRVTGSEPLRTIQTNMEHHKSYARLLSVYIVFGNRVGIEDGVSLSGSSSITNPNGDVLIKAKDFDEDLIVGELDSAEIERARRFSRHFLDERPEIILRNLTEIIARKRSQ